MRRDFDADARHQRAHRLAVGQHAGAVRLHRGDDDVIHDFDLFFARQTFLRLRNRCLRLRHADPLLVLRESGLNIADALEVFVELRPIVFAKSALHRLRVLHHRVEHAALLREHGLLLFDGRGVLRKEPMKRLHRAFVTADGLATHIPSHRKPRPMPRSLRVLAAIELQRRKTRVHAQFRCRHQIRRDAVVKRLPRLRETVRAREPHRAAPVPFVRVFVPKPLHHREVRLVPRQRLQALRQRVIFPRLLDVRKPRLRRDPPAKAEKHQPLRRCNWNRRRGKTTEAQRFQSGQSNKRGAGLEEVTAGFHELRVKRSWAGESTGQ